MSEREAWSWPDNHADGATSSGDGAAGGMPATDVVDAPPAPAAAAPAAGVPPSVTSSEVGGGRLKVGIASSIGWRPTMEDAHSIHLGGLGGQEDSALLAVFDGHGGGEVARYAADTVREFVEGAPSFGQGSWEDALREALLNLDDHVCAKLSAHIGSTATLALCMGSRLVVAGLGDSRCMLARDGEPCILTVDHKPGDKEEMERIHAAGGYVLFGRVNGNLNLSRALGDAAFKDPLLPPGKQQITAEPDIRSVDLDTARDRWLLLACDGVWNSMSEPKVLSFIEARLKRGVAPAVIAADLCAACNQPARTAGDNVTAVLACFT